jgi:hypothetical protein
MLDSAGKTDKKDVFWLTENFWLSEKNLLSEKNW